MTSSPRHDRYDAVVVGARCAGAATALLLARQGLRVLAIDRSRYGSDTLSTHALMRGGVMQLQRWGLLETLEATGTPAVRTTSFHYDDEVIEIPIKSRDGVDALYAPRRTVIDTLLEDAASDAGVEFVHEVKLVDLIRNGDERVTGAVIEDGPGRVRRIGARIVIGADGRRSSVARLAGAGFERKGSHASGVIYGYWTGLETSGYHWCFRPGVSAGEIPTNDGAACVFVSLPSGRFAGEVRDGMQAAYHRILRESAPELATRVAKATQVGRFFGFPGEVSFMRRSWGPGWALVGDAAYFKDPITAHGITDALRDSELLARAVAEGSEEAFGRYQATRDDLSAEFFDATDEIASYEWSMESLQAVHLRASKEMNREVKMLARLGAPPGRSDDLESRVRALA
jgi:2-polyprenyl-6-methoxyphenol hydroxylase-like FAD-dependent oxidoreductase